MVSWLFVNLRRREADVGIKKGRRGVDVSRGIIDYGYLVSGGKEKWVFAYLENNYLSWQR